MYVTHVISISKITNPPTVTFTRHSHHRKDLDLRTQIKEKLRSIDFKTSNPQP